MTKQYLSLCVSPEDDGKPVKLLLRQRLGLPGGFLSHLKFVPEGILLNGETVHVDRSASTGDTLSARIDDVGQINRFAPVNAGAELVWQDEYLAVFCKQAGTAVHGADVAGHPTVANFAAYLWGREQPFHPINRLDRDTTGLMCAARCRLMHELMRRQLHTAEFCREYLAVCDGVCPPRGRIDRPVGGKQSVTDFERLWTDGSFSLLRLSLSTGRTHQIRAHMAALGYPLTGDGTYGGSKALGRPALHSAFVRFWHPVTGEERRFSAPLPRDMADFLTERGCELTSVIC